MDAVQTAITMAEAIKLATQWAHEDAHWIEEHVVEAFHNHSMPSVVDTDGDDVYEKLFGVYFDEMFSTK